MFSNIVKFNSECTYHCPGYQLLITEKKEPIVNVFTVQYSDRQLAGRSPWEDPQQ